MQRITKLLALCAVAICTLTPFISPAQSGALSIWQSGPSLYRVGHDGLDVDRALKRYSGMVTALGEPDEQGRVYSFQVKPLPAGPGYAPNELRGWRLTLLAGQRFASVFEVESNTESEITVAARDGPLDGVAVRDLFVVEQIPVERQQPVGASDSTSRL
jgi:hypothetical protein